MCSATSLLTSCCFLRASANPVSSWCYPVAAAGSAVPEPGWAEPRPKIIVEQLTCRSMKAISQGVLEPSEDRWQREQVCPHARRRPHVGRRKIDNECDLRKNSVNSFYPNHPNCPCVNRFVRVIGRDKKLLARVRSDPRTLWGSSQSVLVNQPAEPLTKLRQRNACLSAPNR